MRHPFLNLEIKTESRKTGIGRPLFKNPLIAVLVASFIAFIYVYSLHIPAVKNVHVKFEDFLFRVRYKYYRMVKRNYLRPEDIILVTIDEESYGKLERRWPWSRDVFADFLDKISKYEPKVIALDFSLYGESPDKPEADLAFAEAIKRCGNVIVASVYSSEDKLYLGPHEIIAKASMAHGVVGAIKDEDDVLRRIQSNVIVFKPQKTADIPFEIKTAAHYLDVSYDKIYKDEKGRYIMLRSEDRSIQIPIDESSHILINYLSDMRDIRTIPIWKVMAGEVPKNIFDGKLVLVCQTGGIYHDFHPTPLGFRPGGMIIVNVLNSIITSSYITKIDSAITTPIIVLIYLLAFILFYRTQPLKGFFILIAIVAICLNASFLLFLKGIMLPIFYAGVLLPTLFLAMTFYKYAVMVLEGTEIKRMAITDSLTGLYTHRYFRLLLDHTVDKAVNAGSRCSLVLIKILNIDRIIKDISFTKGQMVQKKIAELIEMKLPMGGYGTYLGIGEFGMLLPKIDVNEALGIAGSLRDHIAEADFAISEDFLKPTAAIGVSEVNATSFPKTGPELMRSARVAMARAKEMGYNKVCRFNPKIDSSIFEPDVIEKQLRQRLDDEFSFLAVDLEERNKELEDLLRQLSVSQRELEQAHFETLRALVVAIEEKDPCTAGHSERVGDYSEKIGRELRIPEEELRLLRQAGVLHDIGKVGIPQDILRKEDKLNPSEKHIIELHPEFSVRILNTSRYFNRILPAIRDHHERLDGSGYPRGLSKERISMESQIIAVSDVFDAMTTNRPYRKALSQAEAFKEIVSHPEKYNSVVAAALKKVLTKEHALV